MNQRTCPLIATLFVAALLPLSASGQSPATTTSPTPVAAKNPKTVIEPRKPADLAAFRTAVGEARIAMDAGDFAAAEKAYAQAITADPSNSRARFNRGVAQYKGGNLKGASESFAAAAQIGDAELAANAMFNQGNAVYADALKQIGADQPKGTAGESAPVSPQADLKPAIEAVTSAFTHFKDAASADQLDVDARVNAETAARLLKNLEEMKKKQDEQKKEEEKKDQDKKQDQDQKQDQNQDQKQDQKKDQKQDDKKNEQGKPKDDQSKDGQPKDDEKNDKKGEKKDEKKPSESKPDETKDGKEKSPKEQGQSEKPDQTQDKQPQAEKQPQAGDPVKDAPLTKQDAERLLQAVRDREKARKEVKEAKELAQPARRTPASKDW